MTIVTLTTLAWTIVLGIVFVWGQAEERWMDATHFAMGLLVLVTIGLVIGSAVSLVFL